jgi:hypothetical protein
LTADAHAVHNPVLTSDKALGRTSTLVKGYTTTYVSATRLILASDYETLERQIRLEVETNT